MGGGRAANAPHPGPQEGLSRCSRPRFTGPHRGAQGPEEDRELPAAWGQGEAGRGLEGL